MKYYLFLLFLLISCSAPVEQQEPPETGAAGPDYLDYSGRDDILSGGVKMIPVSTEKGEFRVWTKRVGNNPRMKVLLLHGGPGMTHEYFEIFDSYFPQAGIEYYYYDQLESEYSDQPLDSALWTIDRYVDEVEQVRKALGLDKSNFYILGSSWGGILAMEYALKYQENLKGLIISNMMSSIPAYNDYANNVLAAQIPEEVVTEIRNLESAGDYANPRYNELLLQYFYPEHVLRKPIDQWPEPVLRSLDHMNTEFYIYMQGPSEFGIIEGASLYHWDRSGDLGEITVPTLMIGGTYDTMDPGHMEWMAGQVQNGRYLHIPDGSHLAMYDNPAVYFTGVIDFIKGVDGPTR